MSDIILQGKTILLGVTGGIAAYKSAELASLLKKRGADVRVIMTKNACEFIAPRTFETLTGHPVVTDVFSDNNEFPVEHIALAELCDLTIIAPATANIIAKIAHGIADDMLSTTLLAVKSPVVVAPAMNANMYENPATVDNINILKNRGIFVMEPDRGVLACGTEGPGRLPAPGVLAEFIELLISREKLLAGKKVLVSAGPTRESIDPVRFITNHSSGKMGYALAREAARMGGEVTLVSGPVELAPPIGAGLVPVMNAASMAKEIKDRAGDFDIIIMCAAVADFTPETTASQKIKKDAGMEISLKRTEDILSALCENRKPGQFICGFSMETENIVENSIAKLQKKKADMIVANDLNEPGAGFAVDTNAVKIITKNSCDILPVLPKDEVSFMILKKIAEIIG